MKILVEYFKELEKLFDWYFHLTQIKRIQLNYILVIAALVYLTYKNDEQHRKNYIILSTRIDDISNARSKEQKEYIKSLEVNMDRFRNLLEKLLVQREEIKQIKEKQ